MADSKGSTKRSRRTQNSHVHNGMGFEIINTPDDEGFRAGARLSRTEVAMLLWNESLSPQTRLQSKSGRHKGTYEVWEFSALVDDEGGVWFPKREGYASFRLQRMGTLEQTEHEDH